SYEFANIYLINTHNGYVDSAGNQVNRIDVNDYPAIKKHLDKYWDRLEKRYDQGDTPYNLRNCAYMEDFDRQKVGWKAVGKKLSFSIIEKGIFITAPAAFFTSKYNLYLLAILLSNYGRYFIYQNSDTTGAGDLMLNIQSLEKLLVPYPKKENLVKITQSMKTIISAKNDNIINKEEEKINEIIYEKFNF